MYTITGYTVALLMAKARYLKISGDQGDLGYHGDSQV